MKFTLILVIATGLVFFTGCEPENQKVSEQQVLTETQSEPAPVVEEPVAEVETEAQVTPAPEAAPAPAPEAAPAPQVAPTPETMQPMVPDVNAPAHDPNEVYVTVNGQEIKYGDVMDRAQKMTGGRPMPPQIQDRIMKQSAEQIVTEKLLDEEVKKQNIEVTPEQAQAKLDELVAAQGLSEEDLLALLEQQGVTKEQVLSDILKGMRYEKLIESQFAEIDVTEQEAREFYDQNIKSFQQPEQVRASHILIDPKKFPSDDPNNTPEAQARALAEQIKKQIDEGANFEELAKQHSSCPSAATGGDLDFFSRGQMVKPFEDVAFALEPNQVSDIVETRFGYHIIKVTDKKPEMTTSFDEAKETIMQQLQVTKKGEIAQKYLKDLQDGADIVYTDPANKPQAETEIMPMQ